MKPLFVLLFIAVTALAQSQSFDQFINEGDAFYNQKNYTSAVASYSEAIRMNKKSVLALNKRANAYLMLNQPDNAGPDLDAVLKLDPNNAFAYGNRGLAFRMTKRYKEAIIDFSNAIQLQAKNVWAYNMRGESYKDLKEYELAISDFTSIITIDPQNYWGYMNRGICEYQLMKYEAAIDDLTTAIGLNEKPADAYAWRGYTYAKLSMYDLAIEDYSQAIRFSPTVINNYNNRGLYYNQLGKYSESVADFERCIKSSPNSGNYYISIISPLVRLGKLQEANAYYQQYVQKGLKSYVDNANYEFLRYYLDALQLMLKGNYDGALTALDKANELYGNELKEETQRLYVDMMYLEGLVLEKMNWVEDAIAVYEQSLMINPYQPDAQERIKQLDAKANMAANADKTAPEIMVITPANTQVELGSENSTIQIIGKAKDPSGIEFVKVNGVAAEKLEEDGLFITNMKLAAGQNNWVITASDKRGNIATQNMVVQASAATRGTSIAGKGDGKTAVVMETTPVYHAILIAEQNYDDPKIPDLQNPKRDALELGEILEKRYGFPSGNIDTLFDRSREDIMSAIVKKSSSLTENESLIIFYAGHGIAEKDKFGDVDGYWIPSSARSGLNASYISTDDINKAIKRSSAKHILIIADACFSGAMTRALPPDAAKELSRQYVIPSRKVMASGNLEPVPDNSKFIFYLKKKLLENTETYLTAKDLFDSFYKAVLSNSETLPQYAAIKNVGDEGGEFIFIKK